MKEITLFLQFSDPSNIEFGGSMQALRVRSGFLYLQDPMSFKCIAISPGCRRYNPWTSEENHVLPLEARSAWQKRFSDVPQFMCTRLSRPGILLSNWKHVKDAWKAYSSEAPYYWKVEALDIVFRGELLGVVYKIWTLFNITVLSHACYFSSLNF